MRIIATEHGQYDCSSNKEQVLEKFQQATPIFQALGDTNRQQIIILLLEHSALNVNQITEHMEISRPAVSHHLKILRQAGLITFDKQANEKLYSLRAGGFMTTIKELMLSIEAGV
ncbi:MULTISPECIES: ArsR/SmtB family transcription factor [Paenibacillus]|uniref:Metalloregulator ArsR/SmtB family transcription factor n=1 Tax=Paenibacillus alvei TaxID=44250 RepID=A0ABT4EDH6_PAEAL|nr:MULTISPECIES: metalloregulator ArsR/SmtB family transcription factor [Paenibacillus]EPY13444.1 ArsR family transcriptional regulator [Paenibacillus alvei A6-6i-x]MCY9531782.1 metalloregulator ArsR/SmtB family transcription factor [Paenibacillus alvei]SDG06436.1 DNA-binding transcriptional regulator, ArsR family [Paenibacillus sp. cl6col]